MDNTTTGICDLVSDTEDFKQIYMKAHGYVASIVCIIGLLGNGATVMVLTRPKMASTPVNFLLTMVAIANLLLLAVYLPYAIHFYIIKRDDNLLPFHVRDKTSANFAYFCLNFMVICHFTSIWHTIAVACFRWLTLGISSGKNYATLRNARICSLVLVICNVAQSVGSFLTNDVIGYVQNNCHFTNVTFYTVAGREGMSYYNWLFACFGKIIPAALLGILTGPLLRIMMQAETRRLQLFHKGKEEESRRHQEHNRTTGMLLAVVIIIGSIELPHGIYVIVMKYDVHLQEIYSNMAELIDLITIVAFSINFVLYTVMSRQFRATFYSLFCKRALQTQIFKMRHVSTMLTSLKNTDNAPRDSNPDSLNAGSSKYNLDPCSSHLLSEDSTNTTTVLSDTSSAGQPLC